MLTHFDFKREMKHSPTHLNIKLFSFLQLPPYLVNLIKFCQPHLLFASLEKCTLDSANCPLCEDWP